jgi:hypothetical protein
MRGKAVGLIAALLSGGCASKERDCAFLAPGYARLEENLAKLPAIPSATLPIDARQTMERCYPVHPYLNYFGQFSFVGAKKAKNGNIF